MNDDLNRTVKTKAVLPELTEEQLAQIDYNRAFDRFIKEPNDTNLKAFKKANQHLLDVKDAYRLGWILLQERVNRLKEAIVGLTFR